jgi:hypothetical protein
MRTPFTILILLMTLVLFQACEQEYIPVNSGEGPKYVVEGYVEAGQNPFAPYVILTSSFDFYGSFTPDDFTAAYVHDADVRVSDGSKEVLFTEICFSELDSSIREEVAARFGFDADSLAVDICVYVDILNQLQPQIGKTYNLTIHAGEDVITASTTIPPHVPFDSLHFAPPPGEPNDTLAQLECSISDPAGQRDFYRYFMATNDGGFETSFSSVFEDLFFDGKSFDFSLFNPATQDGDSDPDEFGLYFVGDTITIKWCNLDEDHFNFWNTLEYSNNNQGPFSSYTRLDSNINGGLGIWGGYSVSYYKQVVEY